MTLAVLPWRFGYAVFEHGRGRLTGEIRDLQMAEARRDEILKSRASRKRSCLCCKATFTSEGPHNRLCNVCRGRGGDPDYGIGGTRLRAGIHG